ncbi:MAG: arylsulfatase [Verrucomicrobia bacterium]|nr:arylsulfatase [Verrucomicrobiota bacterium]
MISRFLNSMTVGATLVAKRNANESRPRSLLHFIAGVAVLLNISCLSSTSAEDRPPAVSPSKPNILIIMSDDMGFSDPGFQGSEIETPNLDKLANNGLTFTNFYNCARCGPTRASISTGLYSHQVGCYELEPVEPGNNVYISEVLGDQGYSTYMSGKWHLGNTKDKLPPARGFNHSYAYQGCCGSFWDPEIYILESPDVKPIHYGPEEFHATDATTDYAVKFLQHHQKNEADNPFFLYLAYQAPHFPLHAPKELIDKYLPLYEKGWDKIRRDRWNKMRQLGLFTDVDELPPTSDAPPWHDEFANPVPLQKWDDLSDTQRHDQARRMAIFAAMMTQMDQGIGKVIQQLKDNGQFENTLIFFLSDNGANYEGGPFGSDGPFKGAELDTMGQKGTNHHTGAHWAGVSNTPFKLYKHFNHEGGINTPMVVHWPKGLKRKGERETQRSHVIDIMATVMDVTGSSYPAKRLGHDILPMEGTTLMPALRGGRLADRVICFEHEANRAIFKGKYKLVSKNFTSTDGQTHHDWELYDIDSDPLELNNIASDHYYDLVIPMAREWHAWATRTDGIVGYERWMLKLQYYWRTGLRTYLNDSF